MLKKRDSELAFTIGLGIHLLHLFEVKFFASLGKVATDLDLLVLG
jgi:hypothetical protein